jgi:hypothetical protein
LRIEIVQLNWASAAEMNVRQQISWLALALIELAQARPPHSKAGRLPPFPTKINDYV